MRTVTVCVPVHAHGGFFVEKPGTVFSFARPDCREIGAHSYGQITISIELNPKTLKAVRDYPIHTEGEDVQGKDLKNFQSL